MIEIIISLYRCLLNKKDTFILSKAHSSIPFCIMLRDYGYKPEITTHLEIDKKMELNAQQVVLAMVFLCL